MNKITTNSYCSCGNDNETILRIVAGNDFTLRLRLTQKDGEQVVPYDLSNAEDLIVRVVTPDGDRILLDSFIDTDDKIITTIDAQKFDRYVPYSIEVIWRDEPYDKRAAAPNLFTFVNSSQEANDAQDVIVDGPYDYNLEIISDVAYVTLGEAPTIDLSVYVTHSELDDTLSAYAPLSSLDDYAPLSSLDDYAPLSSLDDYVTQTDLDDTLTAYITQTDLDDTLTAYAPLSSLDDYITRTDLDDTLTSYVTQTDLDDTLTSYITQTDLDDTLSSYVTQSSLSSNSYVDELTLINNLSSYINSADYDSSTKHINLKNGSTVISYIDAADFVIDGMVDFAYVDSGYLMIIFNTDAGHEDIAIPISDIFDANNYYNRTDIDNLLSSYVDDLTFVNTLSSYVTQTSLSSNSYVTETYFSSYVEPLDDRVTYLETYGGGGGGGTIPSNVVTSYDATYIYCLTQAQYDSLEQQQQLDPYTFYYITDTTNNYVTQAALSSNSYITQTALSSNSYITQTDLSSNSYITQTALSSNSYVKRSTLNNTLTSYVKKTELSACSYVDSSTIRHIVKITQTDYDNLSSIDANTLYVII